MCHVCKCFFFLIIIDTGTQISLPFFYLHKEFVNDRPCKRYCHCLVSFFFFPLCLSLMIRERDKILRYIALWFDYLCYIFIASRLFFFIVFIISVEPTYTAVQHFSFFGFCSCTVFLVVQIRQTDIHLHMCTVRLLTLQEKICGISEKE